MQAAIDNDVLLKGAWYGVILDLVAVIPAAPADAFILGQAKFVIGNRLEKSERKGVSGAQAAKAEFQAALQVLSVIEPTAAEQAFAAGIEKQAQLSGLELDLGESLLCAVALSRQLSFLATGDKRAIRALEALLPQLPELHELAGKLLCMEQLLGRLLPDKFTSLRNAICAVTGADKAISNCFACSSAQPRVNDCIQGLTSYVNALRREAPTLLSV